MSLLTIEELTARYEELIRPSVLLRPDEVEEWLTGHPREDVQAFIDACVWWEDYEYAAIGKRVLDRI